MRFAQITELGSPPVLVDLDTPVGTGALVLRTLAVAYNPVDIAIGSGRFYAGHPPLPYVPGIEAVGLVGDRLVYAQGSGRGITRDGFTGEHLAVDEADLIDLPDGIDPGLAVALGTAGVAGWLATTQRAAVGAGDRVVVLGASGAVGTVAVQAARHRDAAVVVAVGRDEKRLAGLDGADAVVPLGDDGKFVGRVLAAAGGAPTVVIDMLWGAPVAALIGAVAPGARVVNVGASAGAESNLPSAAIRGKQLALLGYSNFGVPREEFVAGYLELLSIASAGGMDVAIERFGLDDAASAWITAATGAAKAVVIVEGAVR